MAGAVTVQAIGPDDLEDLARFLAREAQGGAETLASAARDARHYRWFLLENPAQPPGVPCGWIARNAAGEIVGSKFCAAERFVCAGRVETLLMGGGFYVAADQRGLGISLMRRYLEQGKQHALFASTMNETSGAFYEHYGGYPVQDTDHEWLGVLHWPPLVEEVLVRRLGRPALARALAAATALRPAAIRGRAPGELRCIASPAELADLAIAAPPEHAGDITHLRDEAFLRWRYFEGPDATRALFVYRAESGAEVLVAVNLRCRGARGQVRALMVLDYWGALPAAAIADVAHHLAARYRSEADVIVFRGQPPPRQQALAAAGFVRRALPRAIGVCIDRHGLLPTRSWYMVPADGDMGH